MALQLDSYPDIAYGTGSDLDLSIDERRQLWKWEAAVGYRIFAAMRWGDSSASTTTRGFRTPTPQWRWRA